MGRGNLEMLGPVLDLHLWAMRVQPFFLVGLYWSRKVAAFSSSFLFDYLPEP